MPSSGRPGLHCPLVLIAVATLTSMALLGCGGSAGVPPAAGNLAGADPGPGGGSSQASELVYVGTQASSGGSLISYSLDPSSGATTQIGTTSSGHGPDALAADASGRNLFGSGSYAQNPNLFSYVTDSSGVAKLRASDAMTVPHSCCVDALAVNAEGTFAYGGSFQGQELYSFAVDPSSKQWSQVGLVQSNSGKPTPTGLALGPDGDLLFMVGRNGQDVAAYFVNGGAISAAAGSPTNLTTPFSVAVDSTEELVAVLDFVSLSTTAIDLYHVERSSGTLTPVSAPTFQLNAALEDLAFDPSGNFLFSVSPLTESGAPGNQVFVFQLDRGNDTLSQVAGSPFDSQGSSPMRLAVDPSGAFLFVVNSAGIAEFGFNSSTGALRPMGLLSGSSGAASVLVVKPH
jgi:6-phosphogluconolactonase (cycloisomerase 2 family)